jgi:Flp pilus assembly protein TadD, contains TPR repeats
MLAISVSSQNRKQADDPVAKQHADVIQTWQDLLEKDLAKATTFCTKCLSSPDKFIVAEGRKCLANVELRGASTTVVDIPDKKRGGSIRAGYAGPGVDRALNHLNEGIAAAPDDISIHKGRLYILIASNRFTELYRALEQSIQIYTKPDALDNWLDYCGILHKSAHYEEVLEFTKILEKHYPTDHRPIANVGVYLIELERYDEALPYLEKAVSLEPNDPIDNWDLGYLYELTDKLPLAEKYYRKGISVEADKEQLEVKYCSFAKFLEVKRNLLAEACELQKQHCPRSEWTACR